MYICKLNISHTVYKSKESRNDQYPVTQHVENIPAIKFPIRWAALKGKRPWNGLQSYPITRNKYDGWISAYNDTQEYSQAEGKSSTKWDTILR